MVKEGINGMGTKPNVLKEAITPPIVKKNIDTVKKQRNHMHLREKKRNSSANNKNKGRSLDKIGFIKGTEIECTIKSVNKSSSISSASLSDKSIKIENTKK